MIKYILDAILVCVITIIMTRTIATFYECINYYCIYQDNYISSIFEEAGIK